jgi:hypothetical protein
MHIPAQDRPLHRLAHQVTLHCRLPIHHSLQVFIQFSIFCLVFHPLSEPPMSPNTSWTKIQVIFIIHTTLFFFSMLTPFQGVPSPSPSPFIPGIFFDDHQARFQPPLELARML